MPLSTFPRHGEEAQVALCRDPGSAWHDLNYGAILSATGPRCKREGVQNEVGLQVKCKPIRAPSTDARHRLALGVGSWAATEALEWLHAEAFLSAMAVVFAIFAALL